MDMASVVNKETLKYAVQRQIQCRRSGKILDIRKAVLLSVRNPTSGASATEVFDSAWWDGPEGLRLWSDCMNSGVEFEIIDGRKLK